MIDSIGTELDNINGETFRMNYINVDHLVQLYDDAIPSPVLSEYLPVRHRNCIDFMILQNA